MSDPHVFTDASLADPSLIIDQGGDTVLRLWLPGGITIEDDPDLDCEVRLNAALDDQLNLVVTKVEVEAKPGGPGITAARLRELPFGAVVDKLLSTPPVATMVRRGEGDAHDWEVIPGEIPLSFLAEARRRTQTQRGRRADEDERLAMLSKVAEIARKAKPRQVLADITQQLYVSESRAKKLLRAAREAGVLEHSSRSLKGER